MSDKHTQVYFWGPLWGRFLPMDLAAIFFHNQVLDPIIYYKMLTKRLLMLHASAIGADDEVYLFSGDSGAGKTSLAFRFLNKGYRFLGDDLVFVSSEQKVLSYPKRVHYFSYLKDKNPFLKIPVSKAISAALRESARNILNTLFKEKFYLSTRLHIGSLFPSALYMDKGSLNTIFLLKTDKPISFDDVVFSSDARSFLLDVILKGRKDIAGQTENLERAVLSRIVEKTKIISAAMDEVKI